MSYSVFHYPLADPIHSTLLLGEELPTVATALQLVIDFSQQKGEALLPLHAQAVAAISWYRPQSGWYLGSTGIIFITEAAQ